MSMDKGHILVVDDEILNREIIQVILEDENYQLSMAENGQEALDLLNENPHDYDVILLDRMMPVMDGLQVLKQIRLDPNLRHCPVILQTAKAANAEIMDGIKAGAYYYLAKPFEAEMLVSIVQSAMEERRSYLSLQGLLSNCTNSLNFLDHASFRFQQLEEARHLAFLLASACEDSDRVINGLMEIMINAIEHGNLGISYVEKSQLLDSGTWEEEIGRRLNLEENQHKYVKLNFNRSGKIIEITISDDGDGFEWQEYMTLDPVRAMDTHGRGIAIANQLCFTHVEYSSPGNSVKLIIDE